MSEDRELLQDIQQFLESTRKTEAELERDSNRELAQGICNALGHPEIPEKAASIMTGEDTLILAMKKLETMLGHSAKGSEEKDFIPRITSIPDSTAAKALIVTAASGITVAEQEASRDKILNSPYTVTSYYGVVAAEGGIVRFPLAAPSIVSTINELGKNGRSQMQETPNIKGTDNLLKAVLEETGFFPKVKEGEPDYNFGRVRLQLNRSGKAELVHPTNKRLHVFIDKLKTPKNGIYCVQITRSKVYDLKG